MSVWLLFMMWNMWCFIFGPPLWATGMQPDTYAILVVFSAFAAQVARKLNF